jgi:hypothetical protein
MQKPICNLAYTVISHLTHVPLLVVRRRRLCKAVVNPLCQCLVSAPTIRHALTSMQTVGNQVHRPRPHSRSHCRSLITHTILQSSTTPTTYINHIHNGRIQEIRNRKDPGAAYVHTSFRVNGLDCTAYIPLVSGNHNQQQQHQNQNNQNQGYGGQQSDNIPGGYGGQQQQSFGQNQGQNQGGDFGVTGGAQYNAPHGSGGAGSASGGGIGSLLGMMNRMSSHRTLFGNDR